MNTPTREQLKVIFKKAKHLRLPANLEEIDFSPLKYFGWLDETDRVYYMLYESSSELIGIRWEVLKLSNTTMKLGMCDICLKHRPLSSIQFVSTKTRKLPKGVYYRTRGRYICSDCFECNKDMKDNKGIEDLVKSITNEDE